MKTIFRLLIIAAIISFIRGPLNTLRSTHPDAWKEAVSTLETIPTIMGNMLSKELALVSKSESLTPSLHSSTSSSSSAQSGSDQSGQSAAPFSSSQGGTNGATSGDTPPQSKANKVNPDPFSINGRSASTQQPQAGANGGVSSLPSIASIFTNPVAGFSQWLTGLSSQSLPLKQVQVNGWTQADTGHILSHFSRLNPVVVLPKLKGLNEQWRTLEANGLPLTPQEKLDYVKLYNQSMALLQLKSSFYLNSSTDNKEMSLLTLLNQPHLKEDQVHVTLQDASTKKMLAQFTVQAKAKASPVMNLPAGTNL